LTNILKVQVTTVRTSITFGVQRVHILPADKL